MNRGLGDRGTFQGNVVRAVGVVRLHQPNAWVWEATSGMVSALPGAGGDTRSGVSEESWDREMSLILNLTKMRCL